MKYDNIRAFEKHLESASPLHFAGVYVFLCKEPVESKEAVDILLKFLLPKNQEFALSTLDGSSLTSSDILTELSSNSFLTPRRVLWIQQADKIKKDVQESIENYIIRPHPTIFLLMTAPALTKTSGFYKKLEKEGIIYEPLELKPWEKEKKLVEWVSKQAATARKVMPHPVCQAIVKQSGNDQSTLLQEFEKLLCYVGEKNEITLRDVEAICSSLNIDTVWQLGESIFHFDAGSALHICQGLLVSGQPLLPLLRQIRSQFQTGCQISTILARGGNSSHVSQEYPYMKGQILERHMQMARQYGLPRYINGLLALDEAETQAKNSQIDDDMLAELLILKLCTR